VGHAGAASWGSAGAVRAPTWSRAALFRELGDGLGLDVAPIGLGARALREGDLAAAAAPRSVGARARLPVARFAGCRPLAVRRPRLDTGERPCKRGDERLALHRRWRRVVAGQAFAAWIRARV
jgi:hypothetical protein